jgi:hypothetical protein
MVVVVVAVPDKYNSSLGCIHLRLKVKYPLPFVCYGCPHHCNHWEDKLSQCPAPQMAVEYRNARIRVELCMCAYTSTRHNISNPCIQKHGKTNTTNNVEFDASRIKCAKNKHELLHKFVNQKVCSSSRTGGGDCEMSLTCSYFEPKRPLRGPPTPA